MLERPADDGGYLEAAARIIFMGGLNRRVVDSKWEGFRAAFYDFDVAKVAEMGPADIDRLSVDDRVIKYRAKLQAIADNAETMQAIADEHQSFAEYVSRLYDRAGVDGTARELARQFAYISEQGARHWLYSTGYDIGEVTDKIRLKYAPYEPG